MGAVWLSDARKPSSRQERTTLIVFSATSSKPSLTIARPPTNLKHSSTTLPDDNQQPSPQHTTTGSRHPLFTLHPAHTYAPSTCYIRQTSISRRSLIELAALKADAPPPVLALVSTLGTLSLRAAGPGSAVNVNISARCGDGKRMRERKGQSPELAAH